MWRFPLALYIEIILCNVKIARYIYTYMYIIKSNKSEIVYKYSNIFNKSKHSINQFFIIFVSRVNVFILLLEDTSPKIYRIIYIYFDFSFNNA